MSTNKFTDGFKRDAVAQVEGRGCPVREFAERLGVSTKSIYMSDVSARGSDLGFEQRRISVSSYRLGDRDYEET